MIDSRLQGAIMVMDPMQKRMQAETKPSVNRLSQPEFGTSFALRKSPARSIPSSMQDQLPKGRAQRHGENDAEQSLCLKGAGKADHRRTQCQSLYQRILEALFQPVSQQDPDKAAHDHRGHIHKNSDHAPFPFPLR